MISTDKLAWWALVIWGFNGMVGFAVRHDIPPLLAIPIIVGLVLHWWRLRPHR